MLEEYNKKRNFKTTPEPIGPRFIEKNPIEINNPCSDIKLHFVVQKHDATRLHYDFRLESQKNKVLISWAVPKGPSTDPKVKRLAILTEDHPLDYLLFEGIIPKGNYGAGSVIVWDTGKYSLDEMENKEEDISDQFKRGKINFILFGQKLKGRFSIIKTSRENQWLLIKIKDKYPFSGVKEIDKHDSVNDVDEEIDLTKSRPESVLSGLTINELNKVNTPKSFEVKKNNITCQINNKTKKENINNILNIIPQINSSGVIPNI